MDMFPKTRIIIVWILSAIHLETARCSHFTGGSVTWIPGNRNGDETEIYINFRIAWKASNSESTSCNKTEILDGKQLYHGKDKTYNWECSTGCNDTFVSDSHVTCTEFDLEDDWSVGYRSVPFKVQGNGPIVIEYTGCCWIGSLVYGGEPWRIPIEINPGIRSDTKKPNSSPVSAVTPVVRFKAGCPDDLDLAMFDAEGDRIVCRLATGEECDDKICTTYPYFQLTQTENTCRLTYNGGGPGNTDVAIALILEDYPQQNITLSDVSFSNKSRLSYVSMQFLVRLYHDIDACYIRPQWIDPTFPNGMVAATLVDQELHVVVKADSKTQIDTINVVGPLTLTKSDVKVVGNQYSVDLKWTPSAEQKGPNAICVTAKDENGKMSEQRCMFAVVGDGASPCSINNGGCSDECVIIASSYICECARRCWILAPDKRTCIPNIAVNCEENKFLIELQSCAVAGTSTTIGSSQKDPGETSSPCQTTKNSTHYKAEIPYDNCDTSRDSDFLEIHWRNRMRVWLDDAESVGSGENNITITRGYWYNINLVCSFNRYANVNASYSPQDRDAEQVVVPGLGSFQFFFDFYMNQNFEYAYSPYEYPITVTVNSDIYFGIRASGGASGLEVFTEKCVAMTTKEPTSSTISYTMIENGCTLDNTMKKHNGSSEMEERFSIKAFRFQQELISDSSVNIYIQCSAVLCVLGQPSTRCQKGCITTRKRRDENGVINLDHQIRTRKRRAAPEDGQSATFAPNVSESTVLQITVSGPFRIDVIPPSDGVPGETVVTPTSKPTQSAETVKVQPPPSQGEQQSAVVDSNLVIIIASSVGGLLLFILLAVLACVGAYHYLIIVPKRKINPNHQSQEALAQAWTVPNEVYMDDEEMYNPYENAPTKPPPSFWELEHHS